MSPARKTGNRQNAAAHKSDVAQKSRRGLLLAGVLVMLLGTAAIVQTGNQLAATLKGLSRPLDALPDTGLGISGPLIASVPDTWIDLTRGVQRLPITLYAKGEDETGIEFEVTSQASRILPSSSLALTGEGPTLALLIDPAAASPGSTIITITTKTPIGWRHDESFRLEIGRSGSFGSIPALKTTAEMPALRHAVASATRICGVTRKTQSLQCWDDSTDSPTPLHPPGTPDKPRQIGLFGDQLCALSEHATVLPCESISFRMPDGQTINSFASNSEGSHVCVLSQQGEAWCGGDNTEGALGRGNMDAPDGLVPVMAGQGPASGKGQLFDIRQIAVGDGFSCAVTRAGAPLCWGQNVQGQLSAPPSQPIPLPRRVARGEGLSGGNVAQIAAGHAHACALTTINEVFCWGANQVGQLGRGDDALQPQDHQPQLVAFPLEMAKSRIIDLKAAGNISCVLLDGGDIACWGELAGSPLPYSATPVKISPKDGALSISLSAGRLSWLSPTDD